MLRVRLRERPRSNIARAPQREWPRHRRHVARHVCIAGDVDGGRCKGKVRACHHRTAANSGTGLKPPDWECWPGCDFHHGLQHDKGQPYFERLVGMRLEEAARQCVASSTDAKMRMHMREMGLL